MISYFRKPNFVFFGTPEFAKIILEKLITAGMLPAAVVCNPDRPVGRKKIITPPPTKSLILKHETWNIKILQPEKLDDSFKFQVSSFKPDFAIVAAYAKIIPKEILKIPRLGIIGVHPSLLPKYRGPSPIQAAILKGDEETGVTLYLLDEKVDHGPLASSVRCQVSSKDTCEILMRKLADAGGKLLVETIPMFLAGEIKPEPQNEAEATYTKKFTTDDAFVSEGDLSEAVNGSGPERASAIERKIRALNPEPGVWTMKAGKPRTESSTFVRGKRVKLLAAEIQNGRLILKRIQEEGGQPKVIRQ